MLFILYLIIGSLLCNSFIPFSNTASSPTQYLSNVEVTDFNVRIESPAQKDPEIDTGERPQKFEREVLPFAGIAPSSRYLIGTILLIAGTLLLKKDWSEEK